MGKDTGALITRIIKQIEVVGKDGVWQLAMLPAVVEVNRAFWQYYLNPQAQMSFSAALLSYSKVTSSRLYSILSESNEFSDTDDETLRVLVDALVRLQIPPIETDGQFIEIDRGKPFEEILKSTERHDGELSQQMNEARNFLLLQITNLTPQLIVSIKTINAEYISWLSNHPDSLDKIAWQAFEQMVAEILASNGFEIELSGTEFGKSADIMAIRTDELGIETKYLIECKRYRKNRKVDLNIVNSVIGSARRNNVDHAMLVTTSLFTEHVKERESEFKDLRLHLRDGEQVMEWLREYEPREDYGLWLPEGWDEEVIIDE